MQARMASQFNMQCIYCLHNLNIQLAVLNYEHQIRQSRWQRLRRWHNPYWWHLPRPNGSWFEIHFRNRAIPAQYFKSPLLNLLHPFLLRQNTALRNCIPPEKVLALGLYRFAHGNSYLTIDANFDVGKSAVIEAVQDVIEALLELRNECINFLVSHETRGCIETILLNCQIFLMLLGQLMAPTFSYSAVDYFSRYHQYDFIVQGVVEGWKLFLDFAAGFPGSLHDAHVLKKSTLYRRAENNEVLRNPSTQIGHHEIRPYLVGDSAILLDHGYRNLSPKQLEIVMRLHLIKSWRLLEYL